MSNVERRWTGVVLVAMLAAGAANAAITWTGGGDGVNWFDSSNWGGSVPGPLDDVVIGAGAPVIVLTNDTTILSLDVTGRTLRFLGWPRQLTASNLVVRNAAKLTHTANMATVSPWTPDNGISISCATLDVQGGGEINADGLGYGVSANSGYGPGGGTGNANQWDVGGGGYGGTGGSGAGNPGGVANGVVTNPATPGSGGGSGWHSTGGKGGGYVRIDASGTVTLNGTITARGTAGIPTDDGASGGSGGGICIRCVTISGSGSINADGGNAAGGVNGQYGGGGGGRIAIHETTPTSFGGDLTAKAGTGSKNYPDVGRLAAVAGTIYVSDWSILPVSLKNGGAARFTAGGGTVSSLTVSNYTMFLEWGWETNRLRAGAVVVKNAGRIMSLWNTATTTNPATGQWDPDGGVFIECSSLNIETGGEINTDGLGYRSGYAISGSGSGGGAGSGSAGGGGGGGYGGVGGQGSDGLAGGVTYGVATNPADAGSGGGGSWQGTGANGGGYVRVEVSGMLTVNGTITADGNAGMTTGAGAGGGASGGGILVQCAYLAGTGTITADGGNGYDNASYDGGGGGGGRISIYAGSTNDYSGQVSVNYGTGPGVANDGAAGTISWEVGSYGSAPVGSPWVSSTTASNITATSAYLNGSLTSTGAAPTSVSIFWGESDGGTHAAQWGHAADLGQSNVGPLTYPLTGLFAERTYFYRHFATNSLGATWGPATVSFTTGQPKGPIYRFW